MADGARGDAERKPAKKKAGGTKKGAAGRKAFLLRLPPELHDELRQWASAELRSLNGQIEFLLRDALKRRKGDPD